MATARAFFGNASFSKTVPLMDMLRAPRLILIHRVAVRQMDQLLSVLKACAKRPNRCVDAYRDAYEAFFEFFERLRYASSTLKGRLVDASGTLIFEAEICNYFSGSILRI